MKNAVEIIDLPKLMAKFLKTCFKRGYKHSTIENKERTIIQFLSFIQKEYNIDYNKPRLLKGSIHLLEKPLSLKIQRDIITLLEHKSMNLTQLAEVLDENIGRISFQINILENAGLIETHYEPGVHGISKIVKINRNNLDRILK